ncbi:MAG: peptidyl-prolyl cis-trans isomerase [Heyndrickxia oleronia]|uniref:peptidyl-prolyl cis-trans isomerase n=1 Tax=Heyndrickxia oleronia TaxID=38875 RepID=UPI00242B0486|nr:peptidyl-prolyl cis-trans isomerase [Heyndrickxia oleronia]MCI1589763.1 peptidyl-prolyl cis-trans isomerase [Heyndrickxia oleronia]
MIIPIKGKVKFPITLDAGTWIFDDRKIDLTTYFDTNHSEVDDNEEYTKNVGRFFDREIKEGAISPPTLKSERKFLKQKLLTGTFVIRFEPFLKNAEPLKEAKLLVLETDSDDVQIPLEDAYQLILAFSKEGKALKDDGPIHVIFSDGSNRNNPIKYVKGFRVE